MTFNAMKLMQNRDKYWSEDTERQTIREILSENCDKKYDIVLDIGCGGGQLTALLASEITAGHIYGVDISADVIEYAKQNHSKDNITYIEQDFGVEFDCLPPELKALEGQVSLIFSNSVFQFVADLKNLSNNMYRLLSKGGKVCASILQPYHPYIDLTAEEKAIHEREVMKIPDPQIRVNGMCNVFKSVGFDVIYVNKYVVKNIKNFNEYKQGMVGFIAKFRQYIVSRDEETIETVLKALEVKIIASLRHFTDETTGEAMVAEEMTFNVFRLRK